GDRVQVRTPRQRAVVLQVAGGPEVDHEEHTTGAQAAPDLTEHPGRLRLVVDRVEGGDQVETTLLAQVRRVPADELGVLQAQPGGLGACDLQGFGQEVVAGRPDLRVVLGDQVHGVAAAATDVGNCDPVGEPVGQAGERHAHVDERGVVHSGALLGHRRGEPRVVGVAGAATGTEALPDPRQHPGQLTEHGQL